MKNILYENLFNDSVSTISAKESTASIDTVLERKALTKMSLAKYSQATQKCDR